MTPESRNKLAAILVLLGMGSVLFFLGGSLAALSAMDAGMAPGGWAKWIISILALELIPIGTAIGMWHEKRGAYILGMVLAIGTMAGGGLFWSSNLRAFAAVYLALGALPLLLLSSAGVRALYGKKEEKRKKKDA